MRKSLYIVPFHNQRFVVLSLLLAYIAVLLVGALIISARRLLWNDELFTYYIATLPSFSQVWAALSTGQELSPPGYYAIVRESLAIFGNNDIALRLPSLMGFLLMTGALFKFVSLRLSPIYGVIAALFPMLTGAQSYSQEARPYGLELGFGALALLCWQRATESRNRSIALGGLLLSLAAAICCHYYGVLLILPLALGEVVRTVERRRIDFAIWACFAASILALLFALPLILIATKQAGVFWAQPHWGHGTAFYKDILANSIPAVVMTLTIAIIFADFLTFGRGKQLNTTESRFPDHELGAILGFIALPLFTVFLAMLVTKAFDDRYALPAVLGLSVLFAQAMHKLLGDRHQVATAIALILLIFVVDLERRVDIDAINGRSRFEESMTLLRSENKENLPIVIAEPLNFVVFSHYAPADVRSRLVYLSDPALAGRLLGFTSVENGMVQLVGPWFHMKVVPLDAFLASNPRFLLYGGWWLNWVTRALSDRGLRIEFLKRDLFSVAPPER